MKKKAMLLLTCLFVSIGWLTAQMSSVSGVVISEEDGEPVVGASVLVEGTTMGTVTDVDGKFTIGNLPSSAKTLQVSFIGMQSQTVAIKPGNLRVILKADSEMLDEVMVVAYGTAKKSAFTGSASVMKSESLEKRQVTNVSNALSGSVSGVQAVSTSGQPGTSAKIRIRGIGSIKAGTNPLYVVDGVPMDSGDGDDTNPVNDPLSSINSQDIESITVLKDAAAAALYGARGANGVVLVTTKKGKTGSARVSLDARWGVNSRQVTNYDVLKDPATYMENLYTANYNASLYNLGNSPAASYIYANNQLASSLGYQVYTVPSGEYLIGTDGKINPNATLGYSDGQYYYTPDDWSKGTFSNEMRQEYNLSVSGGTEQLNYYFSAGYLEDNGVIENSGFERISTRMNVDYQAKKWLKLGTSMSYSNSKSRYPGEQTAVSSSGNAFHVANMIAPVYPMYIRNADGTMMYDPNTGLPVYDYGDSTSSTNCTRNFMSMANPKGSLLYDTEEYLMDVLNGKWYANIMPVEGLTLTASLGLYLNNTRYHNVGNQFYGQSASYKGSAQQMSQRVYGFTQQYMANYKKAFGEHHTDLLLGYESYENNNEYHYVYGYNLYQSGNFTVGNVIDQINGSGRVTTYATKGIIGRFNYDYAEKYYGSISYRRDASSRFHPDHRWGNFWSLSAAWELSKEEFMSDLDWVNMLKVKASFGQQGNDNILDDSGAQNYYPYIDQYVVTGSNGSFADGTLSYKGNPDITWEKSNSFNVGADFALWKGKLSGTVEYFSRKTTDMLYNKPVAPSNGYSSIPMNIGSMRNSGVEIELNYRPIETKDLTWEINANATFLKNKILELHPDLNGQLIDDSRIYREGESVYQLYLVKYAGVDPATGLALYWAKDKEGQEYATSDWNQASNTNKQGTGDLLPTVYGGLGTTLTYRGFDFSIQCAYQLGGKVYDSGYQTLMHRGSSSSAGYNWHTDILNSWTPENPYTDVPRLNSTDTYASSTSDRWLVSSNYFAINNITLGYTLPKSWMRKLGIESLRIYGAADNLALFTARKGLDPRTSFTTVTTASYTALRSVSGGIKLTF